MSALDRAALIAAAEAHDVQECSEVYASPERGTNRFGLLCPCGWRSEDMPQRDKAALDRMALAHRLDAILPLIADAIEADAHALKHRITAASADLGRPLARTMLSEVDGRILAARLVRSLLVAAEQDEPNPFGRALHVIGTPADKTLLEAFGLTAEQDEQDEPKQEQS